MTSKTAMQQMIEMIESVRRDEPPTALWNLKKYAQELLATEKKQITDAHDDGYNEGINETGIHGEEYYNQTFGQ